LESKRNQCRNPTLQPKKPYAIPLALTLTTMLKRTKLLIIDDWGPEPLSAEQRRGLLEIVDDRYEKGSLLITSQIPVSRWHELMGDPTIGDAILDRVVHRAYRIELKEPSLRKPDAAGHPADGES
jgi:DNA replication protein DnaC